MKKKTDYTIETLLFCLLLAVLGSMVGCKEKSNTKGRDYQIEVTNDSITVYDGERKVGTAAWEEKENHSAIECILLEDNL